MAINYTKNINKNSSDNQKKEFIELEIKIFEKILLDYRFKGILYPFAVIEKNENIVVLGSNKEVVGKVSYNYSLESALRELVGSIVGDDYIKIELKIAEAEFLSVKKRIEKNFVKQKEDEKNLANIEEQKIEGRCNLIPFPIKENKVRSDLTIERHAIFASNTFKGDFRSYERKFKDRQTEQNIILRVEVGDRQIKGLGVLKQKHQEAFYKLLQLWASQKYQLESEASSAFGTIEISAYELVQKLRGEDAGKAYKSAFQTIKEMSNIRVNIEKFFVDDDVSDIDNFTLIYYESFTRKAHKSFSIDEMKVQIRFSKFVTDNFLKKNVKSLMLDPYFSLKDKGRKGVAQLLYTMLDYELSSKDKFNISLTNLSNRLGLAQYRYKSDRKRKLESAVKSLNGHKILDNKYEIKAYLEESEDGEDWVFVARRNLAK